MKNRKPEEDGVEIRGQEERIARGKQACAYKITIPVPFEHLSSRCLSSIPLLFPPLLLSACERGFYLFNDPTERVIVPRENKTITEIDRIRSYTTSRFFHDLLG